jgi:acyl transferase domain-containing protein/enoyl-CoA hydratase/carnithine racemase/pimeloyl-ACP methyl ester carboxylesterase/NADP-dependent 3-hydroxy acid dehydrogenase YdfG/tryptophanase
VANERISCGVILRHADFVMQNHRVHGVSVMPGVVFLELVLRILAAKGWRPGDFRIERIRFLEPVATSAEVDRDLRVEIDLPSDRAGSVRLSSRPAGSDLPRQVNMRADLVRADAAGGDAALPAAIDVAAIKARCRDRLDMAELYARARSERIEHGPRMRCTGVLLSDGAGVLAELALEVEDAAPFLMHPAALDATTIAAFGQTPAAFDQPFIPITLESFAYARPLPARFLMFAPNREQLSETGDVIGNDYALYDLEGRLCASFGRLHCKRIRHAELIRRLLPDAPAAPAVAQSPPPRRAAAEPSPAEERVADDYQTLLTAWIAALLGVAPAAVDPGAGFYDLGLDSGQLLGIAERLEADLGLPVYPTLLFEHSTIAALSADLLHRHGPMPARAAEAPAESDAPIETVTELTVVGWRPDARTGLAAAGRVACTNLSERELATLRALDPERDWQAVRADGAAVPADVHVAVIPAALLHNVAKLLHWSVDRVAAVAATRPAQAELVFVAPEPGESPAVAGLAAYCRCVRTETPSLGARVIAAETSELTAAIAAECGKTAGDLPPTAGIVRYAGGRADVQLLCRDGALPAAAGAAWTDALIAGDLCVIAGGGGAIARLLCGALTRATPAGVLLLGRGEAPDWLGADPGPGGADIAYRSCDITDAAAVVRVLDAARGSGRRIRAVIHAAGVLADALHHAVVPADAARVLAPKLEGFASLDRATREDPLLAFVAMGSLAAWRPVPGQASYAVANAALERLVEQRAEDPAAPGRSLAMIWPLWEEGGMRLGDHARARAARQSGLVPLPTELAYRCLDAAIRSPAVRRGVVHGDAAAMRRWLAEPSPEAPAQASSRAAADDAVAIVGLAGRFPKAEDVFEFWRLLRNATDAIEEIPAGRWDHAAIYDADRQAIGKTYGRWGGFLDDIDAFDAPMFNISRKEAERMDPQERLFLETCWTLLEEAGHPAASLRGADIGVFAGVMWNHYQLVGGGAEVAPAAMHAAIANRISYAFDFTGPSIAVDTACSSSLTSLALAIDAVRLGRCRMAIAGGVNLSVHEEKYRQLGLGQFLSEDGRCRSFGAGGSGYVPGEGVGAVLLRPLHDAIADGDHVWGVVRAAAVRHGGRTGGFTVPSPAAQAAVMRAAWVGGDIDPATISYVEAHGTGTSLGDPVEIEGLVEAFGPRADAPLAVGSVKSNIGHLEGAAGIAAIAKVLLMMRSGELVPSLHSAELNPGLRIADTGLFVVQAGRPWTADGAPRRAGISSFGAGGANAHVVIEEAPPAPAAPPLAPEPRLILLSARTEEGLRDLCARLHDAVAELGADRRDPGLLGWIAARAGVSERDIDREDTLAALGFDGAELGALRALAGDRVGLDTRVCDLVPGTAGVREDPALLAAIAHQLQRRRTHLPIRCAFVANGLADLLSTLAGLRGAPTATGFVDRGAGGADEGDPLKRAARLWVDGGDPDLSPFWPGQPPPRISLPVAPLDRRQRFWLGRWKAGQKSATAAAPLPAAAPPSAILPPRTEMPIMDRLDQVSPAPRSVVRLTLIEGGVALVEMDDVAHHNMFTPDLLASLEEAFARVAQDDGVRAVVLTGTPRVFSLGGTPDTLEKLARKEFSFTAAPFLYEGLRDCPVPVVAAMRGRASGGGFAFGLHADLVVMDLSGTYSANFVKFGFTPGLGATYVLERQFGTRLAQEMCLTGRDYGGRELAAAETGLRFAERDAVLDTAIRLARSIADNPAEVVRALKHEYAARARQELPEAIRREVAMHDGVLGQGALEQVRARVHAAPTAAAAEPDRPVATAAPAGGGDVDAATQVILAALGETLFLAPEEIDRSRTFGEMGLDSLGAVEIVRTLNERFGEDFDSVLVYDHPTIDALARRVAAAVPPRAAAPAGAGSAVSANRAAPVQPPAAPQRADPPSPAADRSAVPEISLRSPTRAAAHAARPAEALTLAPVARANQPAKAPEPRPSEAERSEAAAAGNGGDIAIIGMSARYPGSNSIDEFWDNLREGRFTVSRDVAARWNNPDFHAEGFAGSNVAEGRWVGFVDGIDQFDPAFFGISPREAELMDPQQRVFLEQAWRALEHAGYALDPEHALDCGVFAGTASGDYLRMLQARGVGNSGQVFLGNSGSILVGRISYLLNLKGPTVALDTACSSSLVAVHLACQAIRSGDCRLALAGGIGLMVTPQMYVWNANSGMLSAAGRCAAFDGSADGFVLGEGVGLVVLKALEDAVRDRDTIVAVIKASGVNGDGRTNGITAPSADAQLALQRRVHARSGVALDDIGYIETHGAGTQLGDPIEVKALAELVAERSPDAPPCGIGSVKSNIGHTTLAAGVAGLIKVALGLSHRTIPASLHFESLNENIRLDPERLRIVARPEPWQPGRGGTCHAAVNSFGVSGTNCHLVMSEAPAFSRAEPAIRDEAYLLPVSAKSRGALEAGLRALRDDLQHVELADAAFTLALGRSVFSHRAAVVASDRDEACAEIDRLLAAGPANGNARDAEASAIAPEWGRPLRREELVRLGAAFRAGQPIDFASFYAPRGGRRVPMKGHLFARRRFWVPEADERLADAPASRLAEAAPPAPPAAPAGEERKLIEILDVTTPWIADHVVRGEHWLPGAAAIHWILAREGSRAVDIAGLEWLRPAQILYSQPLFCATRAENETRRLTFTLDDDTIWARATVAEPSGGPVAVRPRPSLGRRVDGEAFYRRLADAGIAYGPSFRLIGAVESDESVALATLREPMPVGVQLCDAILQTASVLLDERAMSVPRRIDRLRRVQPGDRLVATVEVRRTDAARFDMLAFDSDGGVVIAVEGFQLVPLPEVPTRAYLPRWVEHRPAAVAAPTPVRLSFAEAGNAEAARFAGDAPALLLDVRDAPDDRPIETLRQARSMLQAIGDKADLVLVTAGAAAVGEADRLRPTQAAIAALARAAVAETAGRRFHAVDLIDAAAPLPEVGGAAEGPNAWREGRWYRPAYAAVGHEADAAPAGRDGLTYLVVGGTGGLGFSLSRDLAQREGARLGWIGRRARDAAIDRQIAGIERLGGKVHYVAADVTDERAMMDAVREIRSALGPISGAYHSALALHDASLARMTEEQLIAALRPKIDGIHSLHAAVEGEPLDRLVVFSSIAALVPAPGQGNYAAASAYVDAFAAQLRRSRGTPTFVVNWGYWGSVGVVGDARHAETMAALGVGSIEPAAGLGLLRSQLRRGDPAMMVIAADPARLEGFGLPLVVDGIVAPPRPAMPSPARPDVLTSPAVVPSVPPSPAAVGVDRAVRYVADVFARVLKLDAADLDTAEMFDGYGVDSLIAMDIVRQLRSDLGDVPSTLLYERLTIDEVGRYLLDHKAGALAALVAPPTAAADPVATAAPPIPAAPALPPAAQQAAPDARPAVPVEAARDDRIAVIGLAGRYPGADGLESFWRNLRAGARSIQDGPADRGDWRRYWSAKPAANRAYNLHGGFLDGIDLFDPRFFGILPSDAAAMDPQERLFLELCWELLERAGHNGEESRERQTGVFVGSMYGGYGQISAAQGWAAGQFNLGHSPMWSIANRVSYQFDFQGPSLCVDTACSSSLTALHLACESLRRGECRQAIAGGVNLIVHPAHHIALSAMHMLGTGAACRTFDGSADGMVPGEAVGAVLLRPLADAVADGDAVLAVVAGSTINAGGRTGGYTVPNPAAQAAAVERAIAGAGLAPGDIDHVEVHGTGTALGDPIEIAGLASIFASAARPEPLMVSSVKANIGHCEGAAGIAGITKALLQLEHGELAPCAGLEVRNDKIDFGASICPVETLRPWPRRDGETRRRACGISSFGAGGANAHVVLVEHVADPVRGDPATGQEQIFLLSATDPDQLRRYAGAVAGWLEAKETVSLESLCFTSQVGRRALPVRAALVVADVEELARELATLADGRTSPRQSISAAAAEAGVLSGSIGREMAALFAARRQLPELAQIWTAGAAVDWAALWPVAPLRCAFPTLPMNHGRYWLRTPEGPAPERKGDWLASLAADHRIGGRALVPGAALLELALEHARLGKAAGVVKLRWHRALDVGDGSVPIVEVGAEGSRFLLRCAGEQAPLATFGLDRGDRAEAPPAVARRPGAQARRLSGDQFYARLAESGFVYGPALRTVREATFDAAAAVAELEPAASDGPGTAAALLDGAMQIVALLGDGNPAVPVGVGEAWASGRWRDAALAVAERSGEGFAVALLTREGEEVARLVDLRIAPLAGRSGAEPRRGPDYLVAVEAEAPPLPAEGSRPQRLLLLAPDECAAGILAAAQARGIGAVRSREEMPAGATVDAAILCVAASADDPLDRLTALLERLFRTVDRLRQSRGDGRVRLVVAALAEDLIGASLAGATRSLDKENPWLTAVHVSLPDWASASALVDECVHAQADLPELVLAAGRRSMRRLEPMALPETVAPLVTAGGLYVVTGGAGALGRLFAVDIARRQPVIVALLGRGPAPCDLANWLEADPGCGSRLAYRQVDVADAAALAATLAGLVAEFGPVRGVVHAAGICRDGLAKTKGVEDIRPVLAPKLAGALALDRCTADQPLDFLLLCASLAGETGNLGQADYAAANRFLTLFAGERERRRRAGLCSGVTVAVAWPLWAAGGMAVEASTRTLMAEQFGMAPLETADGLAALGLALSGQVSSFALVQKAERASAAAPVAASPVAASPAPAVASRLDGDRRGFVLDALAGIAADFLLVDRREVEFNRPLLEMGFDSISLTDMVNRLNARFGLDLLPSVLFECPTFDDVAAYLLSEHGAAIAADMPAAVAPTPPAADAAIADRSEPAGAALESKIGAERAGDAAPAPPADAIAIIGMAGRFAAAGSIAVFWDKLVAGDDMVREVDERRPDLVADPATAAIRGGFVDDIDLFDAAAFGISPREAALMDPQQRLFIEAANDAVQDAGYAISVLKGREVGVFAGVSTSDYDTLMTEAGVAADPHMATGISHAVLANRLSYVFDWTGPSEAIDTACSSSLVALHRAAEALRRNECEFACVGGVNLILSPGLFSAFGKSGMLSPDGRCKTFDADADGYVRGEGVGVVLLRRVADALADGDHIYALLRGSAVNHVGRSSSLTAPNPAAQARVIRKAIAAAAVEPDSIGFVETHGTGTRLGDVVEIEGLRLAFPDRANSGPPLRLGAVKTAIGHLEAAAGIAGVIKTALCLKHGRLVGNRNLAQINPALRMEQSGFAPARGGEEWPIRAPGGACRAGVSSFGFGGANAHVVLESVEDVRPSAPETGWYVVPLSARTPALLRRSAADLAARLAQRTAPALADVAHTLQTGRDLAPARVALVVRDLGQLRDGLQAVAAGEQAPGSLWLPAAASGDAADERALARDWLDGLALAWPDRGGRRCSLPPSPLDRQRHWFGKPGEARAARVRPEAKTGDPAPPPRVRPDAKTGDPTPPPRAGSGRILLERVAPPRSTEEPPAPSTRPVPAAAAIPADAAVQSRVMTLLAGILLIDVEQLSPEAGFSELGLDSILRMDLTRALNDEFGVALSGADLYEMDTVAKLVAVLAGEAAAPVEAPAAAAAAVAAGCEAALPPPVNAQAAADAPSAGPQLARLITALTGIAPQPDEDFAAAGLTSFDMLKVIARLERGLGPLAKTLLFDFPTVEALAGWLGERFEASRVQAALDGEAAQPQAQLTVDTVEHSEAGAVVVSKRQLDRHPDLEASVAAMERAWGKEQGLPGRDIAPFVFLGAGDIGYLHFAERDGLLLAWNSCVDEANFPALVAQWVEWARARGFRPNLLSLSPITEVAGRAFRSTAFGTVQRLHDLSSFSLAGRKMVRLRDKVRAFARQGGIVVDEYRVGTDPLTDARIVELIDQWAARKDMVNPYVDRVREEVGAGVMADRHRVFLTKVQDEIIAAVVITAISSESGYLLDLEFFADAMQNGGLDYTIVEIIKVLQAEGVEMFSFGATLGVRIFDSPNPHPEVERALEELERSGIFKGAGNLQFKNKFRPDNIPIYLCQPHDVSSADISALLMLITSPIVEIGASTPAVQPPATHDERSAVAVAPIAAAADSPEAGVEEHGRAAVLAEHGWNALLVPAADHLVLVTDSWAERGDAFVHERMRAVRAAAPTAAPAQPVPPALPFALLHATASGRAAEAVLLRALARDKRTILHNDLFPSWMHNALDLGCTPVSVRSAASTRGIDLAQLDALLEEHGADVAMCCIELAPNATGGVALGLDTLREAAGVARAHGVPMVFDATRALGNAWAIERQTGAPFWTVVEESLSLATAVTISLSKEYGLDAGGLVATSDPALMRALEQRVRDRGHDFDRAGRQAIAAALADRRWLYDRVAERGERVQALASCLEALGVPVRAAGVHAVLVDARRLYPDSRQPVASTLSWLYRHTGIKAAPHLNAGRADTRDTVRLAVPVGMPAAEFDSLLAALRTGLASGRRDAELIRIAGEPDAPPRYVPRDTIPADIADDLASAAPAAPADANWHYVQSRQPRARRHLLARADGEIEVIEAGEGVPLVLLHPFNIGAGFFAPQFEALAATMRVIAVHAPGAGRTTAAKDLSFAGLTGMVMEAVAAVGVTGRFLLAGASFGGLSALSVALAHPHRVAGLVLLGSSYKVGNRQGEINRLSTVVEQDCEAVATAGRQGQITRETLSAILKRCETMDPRIGLRYLDVFAARPNLLAAARELKVPTLLIHGVHDTVINHRIAEMLAATISGARLELIEDAGHFPSLTCPDRVNALIQAFGDTVAGALVPEDLAP